MYISRNLEKTLLSLAKSFPVLLLTGPRQVGKTTLLEQIGKRLHLGYVSLDEFEIRSSAQRDPGLFLHQHPAPLIIDEIQYAPELLSYIKVRVDQSQRKGTYWLTGSQQFHLMKGVSESLAGRIAIVNLLGLSVAEETPTKRPKKPLIPLEAFAQQSFPPPDITALFSRILRGSYPRLALPDAPPLETFYGSYVRTYLDRDIRDLMRVSLLPQFETFIRLCAARTGQLLNIADLARDAGVSAPTAREWLNLLETSGQIYFLRPYYRNISKRLVKSPKLYFLDTGLVSYLTGWKTAETAQHGAMAGALFETFIVSELLKYYWNQGMEAPIWHFRTKEKQEVDILIDQDGILYPIEIKLATRINERDLAGMKQLKKATVSSGYGAVVCATATPYAIDTLTQAIPYTCIERW